MSKRPAKHDASEHKVAEPKPSAAKPSATKPSTATETAEALDPRAALQPYHATGHVQWDIYRIVRDAFCPYRGIVIQSPEITQPELIKHMQFHEHVTVAGHSRAGIPVVIAVLASDQDGVNRVATKSDALVQFLGTVRGATTEIIMISPCAYASAVVTQIERRAMGPRVSRYMYSHFKTIIPLGPLCSPHRLLGTDEALAMIAAHGLQRSDMKRIYTYDPQIIWLGAPPGSIIAIERINPVSGRSADLRVVVAGHPRG